MSPQLGFFVSIALSFVAWAVLASRYLWPRLRVLPPPEALRPILILHTFRFLGLAFLVPGVVSPDLPPSFAHAAAYGDLAAAALAWLALVSQPRGVGVLVAWVFNLWGSADLLNAFYQGNRAALSPGELGATYFIPTLVVPMLLITHAVAFRLLPQLGRAVVAREGRLPA